MRSDSLYTVGIHALVMIGLYDDQRVTSQIVARSIGCNPVIVRNAFTKLTSAGLLVPGKGLKRTTLGRPACEITLYDVFCATESDDAERMFKMYPVNACCPIAGDLHNAMSAAFEDAKESMMSALSKTTIADLIDGIPPEKRILPELD
jgi:DNA-binding IscR family transcriptional regulator